MDVKVVSLQEFDFAGYRAVPGEVLLVRLDLAVRMVEAGQASYYSEYADEVRTRTGAQARIVTQPSIEARVEKPVKFRRHTRGVDSQDSSGS